MRFLALITSLSFFIGLFAQQQVELDMQRRLALTPANAINDISYNGLGFNYGLAQRFLLSQPEGAYYINQNVDNVSQTLQALDRNWDLGYSLNNKAVQADYNTLQGFGLGGSYRKYIGHYENNTLDYAHVSVKTCYNNQENNIGNTLVKNENIGLFLNGSVGFNLTDKTFLSTKVFTKFSNRSIAKNDGIGTVFVENQDLVRTSTVLNHNFSANRKLVFGLHNQWYGGNLGQGIHQPSFAVRQQFNKLYLTYNIARPKFYSSLSTNATVANANRREAAYETWFGLNHDFVYHKNNNKFLVGASNGVNLIEGQLFYTPVVYSRIYKNQFNFYGYAGRYLKQLTSAYELFPYVRIEPISPFWLTKDAAGIKTGYNWMESLSTSIDISYMKYQSPASSFYKIDNILETSLLVDIDLGEHYRLDLRYTYTPVKNGDLATLIPEHLGLAHFNINNLYFTWLDRALSAVGIYRSIYLNAGVVGGYRSSSGFLDQTSITTSSSNLVADIYLKFSDYYARDSEVGFEVKNIFNNGANNPELNNPYYLFSEGLRLMRTISFTVSKSFN